LLGTCMRALQDLLINYNFVLKQIDSRWTYEIGDEAAPKTQCLQIAGLVWLELLPSSLNGPRISIFQRIVGF
jgi:hypothetical protein